VLASSQTPRINRRVFEVIPTTYSSSTFIHSTSRKVIADGLVQLKTSKLTQTLKGKLPMTKPKYTRYERIVLSEDMPKRTIIYLYNFVLNNEGRYKIHS